MAHDEHQLILPRLVVAAVRGGSGKTTLTLGLIQALRARGLKVAPYKKGPDYIDPFWHSEAAQSLCRNLDPYMMGSDQVLRSFRYHSQGFDCAVVEGNRGLYDGKDTQGTYSTAELAKLIGAPVVLVLNCAMASRTVAAVALGMRNFDPELSLAGVVLNPVGTARQEKVIRQTIEQYVGLPVLGAVPRLALEMPERHMGLVPPQEHHKVAEALENVAGLVGAHVDMDRLWQVMTRAEPLPPQPVPRGLEPAPPVSGRPVRIGVIRDAAFGFYYPENLEAIEAQGAELVFCSALGDPALPDVDGLYIGGGFPETNAATLEANEGFRRSVWAAAQAGLPIYAECGGLMYLGRSIRVDGRSHRMVGVFPIDFEMCARPQGHGYSLCRVAGPNPFLSPGEEFQAHEFHYSQPCFAADQDLEFAYQVLRGKGISEGRGGLIYKRVMGTYHHIHALGLPSWAPSLVAAARQVYA